MKNIKTACIVQGNIRRGTAEVVKAMAEHFDVVILSTWKDDTSKVPDGRFEVVLNELPPSSGLTNRNYQRVSVNAGLKHAEKLGCNYVLKWRTDMLPTTLDVEGLYTLSQWNLPENIPSRIVTCDFRCMSAEPDWFSTITDFFAFGHIEMIKMLWSADGFDFHLPANPPQLMKDELGEQWTRRYPDHITALFSPEAELYATLKSRLIRKTGRKMDHVRIVREYLYILNYRKLGICWFAPKEGFRPIGVVYRHPWWTESVWKGGKPFLFTEHSKKHLWHKVGRKLEKFTRKRDILEQQIWWNQYEGMQLPLLSRMAVKIRYCGVEAISMLLMKLWRLLQVIARP